MFPPALRNWIAFIAIAAMVCGQVVGIHRGFVAEVGGQLILTQADHHHTGDGPSSGHFTEYVPHGHATAQCHTAHTAAHQHDVNGEHEESEDGCRAEKRHTPVKVEIQLKTPPSLAYSFDVVLTSDVAVQAPQFPADTDLARNAFVVRSECPPPMSVVVAQCKVLLI